MVFAMASCSGSSVSVGLTQKQRAGYGAVAKGNQNLTVLADAQDVA
jgi:hypothetical protein